MTEIRDTTPTTGPSPVAERVSAFVAELAARAGELSDAERVDAIRALEELKSAAAAAQAQHTADLDASTRSHHAELGLPAAQHGKGVAGQVALARRESPHSGARHLGMATALVKEMPHTLARLAEGRLSEWRAHLLVRETSCLSTEDRGIIDAAMCSDPVRLDGLGDRRLVAAVKTLAYQLDPEAVTRRAAKAKSDRRVSIRPAPDTMSYLTGLLPVQQGVACFAALDRAAKSAKAVGDPRSRGQVMADTFVERLTGQATADDTNVEVGLVITDRALLGAAGGGLASDAPAHIPGYGIVPAGWARDLIADLLHRADSAATVALRRLYSHPTTGQLVAMDARSRRFPDGLAGFIDTRDAGICRTPWCDAPIRHRDHIQGSAADGETSELNGQGLCEACNHAKTAPGWRARPSPSSGLGHHEVETSTPTGHTYRSKAPPLPGSFSGSGRWRMQNGRAVVTYRWQDFVRAS